MPVEGSQFPSIVEKILDEWIAENPDGKTDAMFGMIIKAKLKGQQQGGQAQGNIRGEEQTDKGTKRNLRPHRNMRDMPGAVLQAATLAYF